jgi:hypothetical protein
METVPIEKKNREEDEGAEGGAAEIVEPNAE